MPNGSDKNLVRLCAAVNGFWSRYKRWPSRVLVDPRAIDDLRDHVLSKEDFAKISARLSLVPKPRGSFVAEDDLGGTYDYGAEGPPAVFPKPSAYEWFGLGNSHGT
jgi:hypothetical protein